MSTPTTTTPPAPPQTDAATPAVEPGRKDHRPFNRHEQRIWHYVSNSPLHSL